MRCQLYSSGVEYSPCALGKSTSRMISSHRTEDRAPGNAMRTIARGNWVE